MHQESTASPDDLLRSTLESLIDPHVVLRAVRDRRGTIVDFAYVLANDAACAYNQTNRTDLIGRTVMDLLPGHAGSGLLEMYRHVVETGEPLVLDDFTYANEILQDDRRYDIRAVKCGECVSFTWRDVTDRHASIDAMRQANDRYRLLAENATDVVLMTDAAGTYRWVSPSMADVFGWTSDDIIGKGPEDFVHPDDLPMVVRARQATATHTIRIEPMRYRHADGGYIWTSATTRWMRDADGTTIGRVVSLRDIEQQTHAQQALAESEQRYRMLAENASDVVYQSDYEGRIQWVSPSVQAWLGWRPDELVGHFIRDIVADSDRGLARQYRDALLAGDHPPAVKARLRTASGDLRWAATHIHLLPHHVPGGAGWVGTIRDCQSEVVLWHALQTLSAGTSILAKAGHEAELLEQMCQVAVDHGGYMFAWYGRRVDDDAHSVERVASSSEHRDYAQEVEVSWGDGPSAQGPTGTSLREARVVTIDDFSSDPSYRPWLDAAVARGFRSSISLPVFVDDELDGVFQVYAAEAEAFTGEAVDHLNDLARQLGIGLARVRERRQLHTALDEHTQMSTSLGHEQKARDTVLKVMSRMRPAETLEATAEKFCRTIVDVGDVDSAWVALIDHDDRMVPLSIAGDALPDHVVGVPVPLAAPAIIRRLAEEGASWMDPAATPESDSVGAGFRARIRDAGFTAIGYAPVRWHGELIALLTTGSRHADGPAQMEQWIGVLDELGSYAGTLLGPQVAHHQQLDQQRRQVRDIIDQHRYHPVFQPVVDLTTGAVRSYEALTRFDDGTRPDLRFIGAQHVGLSVELEVECVQAAIAAADQVLPAGVPLSVNFSPTTVLSGAVCDLSASTTRPLVFEITEHVVIQDYTELRAALTRCGRVGLSVDDTGAGYSSLKHILELQPDFVKLDRALVNGIDTDPARQALTTGLCHFAARTGTTLLAEGVETQAEADTLRELGVHLAQGFLFGRPAPRPAVLPASE